MHTVGLFVTCLVDCLRPQVGVAACALLKQTGASVVYPPSQTCCGQAAFNSGYRKDARHLAQKCINEFAKCDYVVIPSGSCCSMLRTHLPSLLNDDSAVAFAKKCLELSEYLQKVGFAPERAAAVLPAVAYHDSCSGLRELDIKVGPRQLLQAAGFSIAECPTGDVCCGFGGRFAEQFGELSVAMADKKCTQIKSLAAAALVGGDTGCLLHLEGRLRRLGDDMPVMHWAELVANPSLLAAVRQ